MECIHNGSNTNTHTHQRAHIALHENRSPGLRHVLFFSSFNLYEIRECERKRLNELIRELRTNVLVAAHNSNDNRSECMIRIPNVGISDGCKDSDDCGRVCAGCHASAFAKNESCEFATPTKRDQWPHVSDLIWYEFNRFVSFVLRCVDMCWKTQEKCSYNSSALNFIGNESSRFGLSCLRPFNPISVPFLFDRIISRQYSLLFLSFLSFT